MHLLIYPKIAAHLVHSVLRSRTHTEARRPCPLLSSRKKKCSRDSWRSSASTDTKERPSRSCRKRRASVVRASTTTSPAERKKWRRVCSPISTACSNRRSTRRLRRRLVRTRSSMRCSPCWMRSTTVGRRRVYSSGSARARVVPSSAVHSDARSTSG